MNRFHRTLSIALLSLLSSTLVVAQDNDNSTYQNGRVNINLTQQCGESNSNATYQDGAVNINRTHQGGCRERGNARERISKGMANEARNREPFVR